MSNKNELIVFVGALCGLPYGSLPGTQVQFILGRHASKDLHCKRGTPFAPEMSNVIGKFVGVALLILGRLFDACRSWISKL